MENPLTLISTLFFALFAALHAADAPAKPAAGKPNTIVILTDDHGWADLGANGVDPHIRTPNVDQLARDGVRFTHGYVTAPQCTPSRAGLISRRYQNKIGVVPHAVTKKGVLAIYDEADAQTFEKQPKALAAVAQKLAPSSPAPINMRALAANRRLGTREAVSRVTAFLTTPGATSWLSYPRWKA